MSIRSTRLRSSNWVCDLSSSSPAVRFLRWTLSLMVRHGKNVSDNLLAVTKATQHAVLPWYACIVKLLALHVRKILHAVRWIAVIQRINVCTWTSSRMHKSCHSLTVKCGVIKPNVKLTMLMKIQWGVVYNNSLRSIVGVWISASSSLRLSDI